MSEPLLHVDGLVTRFHSADRVIHAVNTVSFRVDPGETLGVVGESGSGKSVTMLSLVRLIPQPPGRIEAGTARFRTADGGIVDLLQLSEHDVGEIRGNEIGFVFQDPATSLNPVMTVGRQVTESLRRHRRLRRRAARAEAVDLLRRVGIADPENRFDDYPHQFSGGMRQRVVIAIALAGDPSLIIADEPTTALDVTVQAQIMELLKRLQAERDLAIIWVSHDLAVVAGVADRALVLYGGTVVESATVDRLFANPQHPYTRALLDAIPGTDVAGERLAPIPGAPPALTAAPGSCPFVERCTYAFARCRHQRPGLTEVESNHVVACFWDIDRDRLRDGVPVAATRGYRP